jgi:hypothetical protein
VAWPHDDRRKPQVLIARAGPTGITAAVLLVDLGCLGIRDCVVSEELSPGEYDELVERLGEHMALEVSDPARALKLVQTGMRYAAVLGFRPRPDAAAALALFGDADPAGCGEEFECGAGGLPFYDPGPEDDLRAVLRRLEERLGPRGFHYLLAPGDVEHDEEFPGEDDPDPEARAWGRLRRAEDWITRALAMTAGLHFGERFFERAWDEFTGDFERGDIEEGAEAVFHAWMLVRRIPGFVPKGRPAREDEERSAAEILLRDNGPRLPELERRLLEVLLRSPFSFFVVRAVVPGRSLRLQELFTGSEHEVRERSGSMTAFEGAVLYARVVSLDSVSVVMGCGAYVIPPSFRFGLLRLRDELVGELGPLDEKKLLALDEVLRDEFCRIVHEIRFPPPPRLQNTDGEELHFHFLRFELACAPREALEALKELAFEWDDQAFARDSELDEAGALRAIAFPWQGRGNRAHPSWSNTTLGRIEIDGPRMTVEVNSAARAARIQEEVGRRLGARARLVAIEAKSVDELRAERAGLPPEGRGTAAPDAPGPLSEKELKPALAARSREMAAAHWRAWFDHPVPVLGNVSPRAAARTSRGRELLDVLLADYESHGLDPDDPWRPDVATLRRELGLQEG